MKILVAVCAAVFVLAGRTAAADMRPAQPGPEMQRLVKALSGRWSVTVNIAPSEHMPKGAIRKGEEVWRPGPGGFSLIEDYRSTDEEGEHNGLAIMWWDEDLHRYQVMWCDDGPPGCLVYKLGAMWQGNDLVLRHEWTEDGKKFESRQVFSDMTPKSLRQSSDEGESGGELKRVFSILASKVTTSN